MGQKKTDKKDRQQWRLRKKIALYLLNFFILLFLLEVIFRIAGGVLFSARLRTDERSIGEKGSRVILCVGDSFTYGGHFSKEESYPYQLQEVIDREGHFPAVVLNRGFCDANSTQVLKRLKADIVRFDPEVAVVLVGATNKFNFIGYHSREGVYGRIRDFFYNLRVCKMISIMVLDIKERFFVFRFHRRGVSTGAERVSERDLKYAFGPDEYHIFTEIAESNVSLIDYLYRKGEYEKAKGLIQKLRADIDDQELLGHQRSAFSQYVYDKVGAYRSDSETVGDRMRDEIAAASDRRKSEFLRELFLFFEELNSVYPWEKIRERMREDINEIVSFCEAHGVRVVLQTYPVSYPMADGVVREAARIRKVPLVDNGSFFASLIKDEDDYARYIEDDTHCTPLGYRMMAEHLYQVLRENGYATGGDVMTQ